MIGDTLYAWQEQEPDGKWGIIAVVVPQVAPLPIPLVTRHKGISDMWEPLARSHCKESGNAIRLGVFHLENFDT